MRHVAQAMALALAISAAGCAEDWRLRHADETARLSATAITEVEHSAGGEDPLLAPFIERAHTRLAQIERAIDQWRNHSGFMSYAVHAPCLRNALLALRDELIERHLAVPVDLETAESMLEEVATHACEP